MTSLSVSLTRRLVIKGSSWPWLVSSSSLVTCVATLVSEKVTFAGAGREAFSTSSWAPRWPRPCLSTQVLLLWESAPTHSSLLLPPVPTRRHTQLTELRDSWAGSRWHEHSQPPWSLCPQVPISFKDLAVRFSEEEWRLLQEGQREFYRDVMRENYETLVSVGTAELLPLSAFLSPMEPRGATGGESHPDEGQKPPSTNGSQGGQPQHSLHLTALLQLVKEIPEYLLKDVKGSEDLPESHSLDEQKVSPRGAVTMETFPPRGVLTCLPESPVSQPSLATTPTGSSLSSGPPADWTQEKALPIKGPADRLQPAGKESPAPSKESGPPTCNLDQMKSCQRQEQGTPGPGPSPGSSPLQGLINCLKEILVPGPQPPGAAPTLLPSFPGLSVLRPNRTDVGSGSPPWPVKTEAAAGDCPLQGLLNCLKEIPEAPGTRSGPVGASPWAREDAEAWKSSGEPRHLQTPPPPRPGPGAGSVLAVVKEEDGGAQTPPVPASCQLSRQRHSPSSTGDLRGVRMPCWGPMMTQASRTSSSPLEALEACLKGLPSAGPSPLQPLATSWSRSPQPGDVGSQRPELQPQGSHSEEATKQPLPPLGLQGCLREGPIRPSGPRGTPTSFSSASSTTDGDMDFGSPGGIQRQRLGKGYPPGGSPLQGLENCLREISVPRLQAAWPCSSTVDRGLRRAEPRNWTADREGQRGEACEPARLGQSGAEAPTRSLNMASPQTFTSSYNPTCRGPTRPAPWRWMQDETATMVSPLHRLESSLKGILPVRPLRFACVTGPGPSPSPCSSSSLSSSDEDPRPEPELWQLPHQERNHLGTCKGPVPLSPAPGASPRGSRGSCPAGSTERTELSSSLHAGRAEERTGGKSRSPRKEEGTECASQADLSGRAGGGGGAEAAGHPRPAPQLEERPGSEGSEEPRRLAPARGQPGAADRTQGKLLPGDPPEPPAKSLPPTAILPAWPRSSLQPPCPCGSPLQQELYSLGAALTQKLDQLSAALTGLTQEVATMRTQVNRLERRPRNLRPKGQASWQWTLPRGPRWASGPGHRRLPYWRQKKCPMRPRPKILRAQAEGCKPGDRPGLSRGKGYLVPQLPSDASQVEASGPTCGSSQRSSSPSSLTMTAHAFLGHSGRRQSPLSPSVPASLPPLLTSPVTSADTEPLAAGVTAVSPPNQPKQQNGLLGEPSGRTSGTVTPGTRDGGPINCSSLAQPWQGCWVARIP